MFKKKNRRICATFIALVSLVSMTAQATEACIKASEQEADRVRFVETHLKVASLQCTAYEDRNFSSLYSNFVKGNRPYLVRSAKPLNAYLLRTGQPSLARHLAAVATRVSFESTKVSHFCERSRLAAKFASKSAHPNMLLAMLPVRYQSPASVCVG